eukprot:CAMPEP_0201681846 /NCGR_PEP_ID=MMETSP0494-20130426/51319_1 /ASSEMBLY_ACC=CAM_ASM_000839 /TAXON_ID=420259 /ORGANISM="Thalassiosira gravida, Strain GMp14c1" /LENGTH=89 /DNA_ID=CAMNT_0048165599 /DNA_START=696 /DNA_END=965 /DNA_ORIENTATION=-
MALRRPSGALTCMMSPDVTPGGNVTEIYRANPPPSPTLPPTPPVIIIVVVSALFGLPTNFNAFPPGHVTKCALATAVVEFTCLYSSLDG